MSEHRRETRQRVFLKGRIAFNNGASSLDCLVRNMSSYGVRLMLSETAALPEAFDLHIAQKDRTYRAILRWRREDSVGVAFDEAGRAAARADGGGTPLAVLLTRVSELEAENAALRRLLAGMAEPGVPASAA